MIEILVSNISLQTQITELLDWIWIFFESTKRHPSKDIFHYASAEIEITMKKDPYWFCISRIVFNLLDIGGRPDLEVCSVYQKWFSAQFVTDPGPPPSWPAIFNNYSDGYLENYSLTCWELIDKLCSNLTKLRIIIWISSSLNEALLLKDENIGIFAVRWQPSFRPAGAP